MSRTCKKGLDNKKRELYKDYYAAVVDKDNERRKRILLEIQDFNARHPYAAISGGDLTSSVKARQRGQALRREDGVKMDKRTRPYEDKLRF